jgi:glycolate dehydrogenase FAD-binding subunit
LISEKIMEQRIISIKEQVLDAIEQNTPIKIVGGNSKEFLGRSITGITLDMADYSGIISYEPTELYITVRAGTKLTDVKQILAEQGQMLAFEPPEINEYTTIGGVVATGMSGPRRPYTGSVRDFVLGVRCINGLAKDMRFGGQVMKNVAGYDLSRLLTGSFGTLAIIVEVTLKVIPIPEFELTAVQSLPVQNAIEMMHQLSTTAIPISAFCYEKENLYLRLSGNEKVIRDATKSLNFDEYESGEKFWNALRDYKSAVFKSDKPIWRLSVPSTSNIEFQDQEYVIDWGGAQYWFSSNRDRVEIFETARALGGSAYLFFNGHREGDVFQPLEDGLFKLHLGLKQAFDPHGILNPGKMYATL